MKIVPIPGVGFDSNVYLIIDKEKALIDTGTGFYADYITKKIKEVCSLEEISSIILTHEHFDHTGGIDGLLKFCDAEVMIHENGAETLKKGLDWSSCFFGVKQKKVKVDRKLKEGDVISLGGHDLIVFHTPGHSRGSICLYEKKSKSLFSGDLIFCGGGIGRTDFYGGDLEELIQSIERIKKLEVDALYPGHGEWTVENGSFHIKLAEQYARQLM